MAKQPTLQELFAHAKQQAFLMFHKRGEVLPMWHAVTQDNEHMILATPFDSDDQKDDTMKALRAMFAERKVKMFVFMCEAWTIKLSEPLASRLLLQDIRPSQHEDRREVLRVNAEDGAGNVLSGQFYILRPEHGPATLSPFEQDDDKGMVSGRMTGLLTKPNVNLH